MVKRTSKLCQMTQAHINNYNPACSCQDHTGQVHECLQPIVDSMACFSLLTLLCIKHGLTCYHELSCAGHNISFVVADVNAKV